MKMGSKQTVLWKIKSSLSDSYLFGSMHVSDLRAFKRVEQTKEILKQCRTFYTEIDLERSAGIDPTIFKLASFNSYEDRLSEHHIHKIERCFQKYFNTELNYYKSLLPILTINKLAESILQSESEIALDAYLWSIAKEMDLVRGGIEQLEDQIHTLRAIPIEYQFKKLKQLCRNPGKFKRETLQMMKYYEEEAITKIYKATRQSLGPLRNPMLFIRNQKMAEFIKSNNTGSDFYVIGAAHLAGDKGVLAKLKRFGFKIEPIMNS